MIAVGGRRGAATNAGLGSRSCSAIAAGLAVGVGWGLLNGVSDRAAGHPAADRHARAPSARRSVSPTCSPAGSISAASRTSSLDDRRRAASGRFPVLVLIAGVVTIVFGLVLHTTRFGRYTYAIGSNARPRGVRGSTSSRHLIKVYALAGLLSGLGGVLSLAYFTTTTISGHTTDNLTAIAAVVIGGTSLFGGVGAMAGTVVGVFIPVVLASGLVIVGVQSLLAAGDDRSDPGRRRLLRPAPSPREVAAVTGRNVGDSKGLDTVGGQMTRSVPAVGRRAVRAGDDRSSAGCGSSSSSTSSIESAARRLSWRRARQRRLDQQEPGPDPGHQGGQLLRHDGLRRAGRGQEARLQHLGPGSGRLRGAASRSRSCTR